MSHSDEDRAGNTALALVLFINNMSIANFTAVLKVIASRIGLTVACINQAKAAVSAKSRLQIILYFHTKSTAARGRSVL